MDLPITPTGPESAGKPEPRTVSVEYPPGSKKMWSITTTSSDDNKKIQDIAYTISSNDFIENKFLLLGKGKKKKILLSLL